VTRAEELIRSTTRAIASTVRDVPPLRLEPAADEVRSAEGGLPRARAGGRPGRWRPWLVPVASAVAAVAVALALVIVKDLPNGPTTPPATQKNAAPPKGVPALPVGVTVPEYYVAWMQADMPYLVVGNTLTGAQVAMFGSPNGVYLNAVYGTAADDREFIVTGDRVHGNGGAVWYLLRITPGGKAPARMTPLPIPVRQDPAGVALSPDATKLAVALPGTPAVLRVYSVATGALLRTWSAPAGRIVPAKGARGSWPFTQTALRWSADGHTLAFTWNGTEIRELGATAPDGNLLARSSKLIPIGAALFSGTTLTCNATPGWNLIEDSRMLLCAGTWQPTAKNTSSPYPGAGKCASGYGVIFDFPYVSSSGTEADPPGVTECPSQVQPGDGAYIGWASADGSTLIGSLVWNGHSQFGVFSSINGFSFTPLPALPPSFPVPAGILDGTDAW
jgi:hypothetical protein